MDSQHPEHDDSINPTSAPPEPDEPATDWDNTGSPPGEETGWTSGSSGWSSGGSRRSGAGASASAQAWLTQLQEIVENLATQSAPVVREVGAKAAEIAALAAERAGPLAQRAAEATAQASVRVAERSRTLAAELRRPPSDAASSDSGGPDWANDPTNPAAGHGSPPPTDHDTTAPQGPTI